jgi:aromatic ring-cleaving dioxygenase
MTTDFQPRETAGIQGYHAHIYYDPGTRAVAERLREAIGPAGMTAPSARIRNRCIRSPFPSANSRGWSPG